MHRLDLATSGLLVLAKTKSAAANLSIQFADRTVQKTYTALLEGIPESQQGPIIDYPVGDKRAITEWKMLERVETTKGSCALVRFYPKTGRKHQLRQHAVSVHCVLSSCAV